MRQLKIDGKKHTGLLQKIAFGLWCVAPIVVSAQTDSTTRQSMSISLEYRPRLEYRDGAFRPLGQQESAAALVSSRSRWAIDYSWRNSITLRLAPQSVQIWGENNKVQQTVNATGNIALFEAWGGFNLNDSWQIRAGRQVISLDDERVFGSLDWAQGGRAHDALAVHYIRNAVKVSGYMAYNQNYRTLYNGNLNNPSGNIYYGTGAQPEKWMQTIWGNIGLGTETHLSLLLTNLVFQNVDSLSSPLGSNAMQMVGAHFIHDNNKIKNTLSVYAQTGHDMSGNRVKAWLLAVLTAIPMNAQFGLTIGSDFLSGNNIGAETSINRSFNPIFGTNHKFYGSMDYFYAGNGHKGTGLSDTYLRLRYQRNPKVNLHLTLHQFLLPTKIFGTAQNYGKDLGRELDIEFIYHINPITKLAGGYSIYQTTPTIGFLKNSTDAQKYQQWVWLNVTVSPTFTFNSND